MNTNLFSPRFLTLSLVILGAAFTRFIPHPPNFTAIGAMALFGGAYYTNKKLAFIIPLAAMFISDIFIGFHSMMIAVYIAFALIVMIGFQLRKNKKISSVVLASVSASVAFFIVTNFAVWAMGTMYPKTITGLLESYTMAIPFFHYNLLGDLFFAGLMFGTFELLQSRFPLLQKVKI